MITHNDAVRKALMKASSLGALVHRNEVGLFYDNRGNPRRIGVVGWPDIDGSFSVGRVTHIGTRALPLAIEVKTSKATRTKQQKKWGERFVSLGGVYVVARYDTDRDLDGDLDIEAAILEARGAFDAISK